VKDVAETPISELSKGYRQRVALADALVSSPPLLILDEPTAGLDPNQIVEVRKLIRELGRQHTILLSTHILPEVEAVCERALVIAAGRLVAAGTLAELKARKRGHETRLIVRGEARALEAALTGAPGLAGARAQPVPESPEAVELTVTIEAGADPEAAVERAVATLVHAGFGVRSVGPVRASLEEVFAALTQREHEPEAGAA
jgi:ABC-2 type transport system ATP-binding protein